MSIFGTIMDKIFHHPAAAVEPSAPTGQTPQTTTPTANPATSPAAAVPAPASALTVPVDVGAVLSKIAADKGAQSNWQQSIVDLLKLLDMDASLDARKQLANELNIHVAADGSPEENIALHKAVMDKLAENGGKIPDSLRH